MDDFTSAEEHCYLAAVSIRKEAAEKYAEEMSAKYGIPVRVAKDAEDCVKGADIICTVTPSKEPYLMKKWIAPGAHINAVGTFSPVTREVTSELVAAARLYSDQTEAMKK